MSINLIACVSSVDNKLAIGANGDLLFKLKEDLKNFYNTTKYNAVIMGMKTWKSLPDKPLKNRMNIVITNDFFKINKQDDNVIFTNMKGWEHVYQSLKDTYIFYVIGGGTIYDFFLNSEKYRPEKLFITEVYSKPEKQPDVFMRKPSYKYILKKFSPMIVEDEIKYRFLTFEYNKNATSDDFKYFNLCKMVLENGNERIDRTNVGTKSIFGTQMRFDISSSIPLLTTKRVAWKHCILELLWFLRGDTDTKLLQKQGVKIWDGNTSREFLDSHGLNEYETGILGPGYGWQWRHFGAKYKQEYADSSVCQFTGGFDQIEYIINEIKSNPYSRRLVVSSWNPNDLEKTALPPCHYTFQFYVEDGNLSCHFIMRSNDLGCGTSFNLFSYTVLTYIIAMKTGLKPKELVYTSSDTHIYLNHISAIKEQLQRCPNSSPMLYVNPNIRDKNFSDIVLDDFQVVGYFPEKSIPMEMAI